MSEKNPKTQSSKTLTINEDWLAVIIGLVLVVLVWLGIVADVPWPLIGG